MNERDLDLALDRLRAQHVRRAAPPALRERVHAVPAETPQRWSWLPQIATGRFDMFSAVKLVAAAAIVALFGGFLLAGVITTPQSDEVAPAAVTDSPEATSEPTEAPTTSVPIDILPGVELTVEEVEPGVYRVVNDGVRDLAKATNLDIVAGHDGGIWLLRPQRFFRLGDDEWRAWHHQKPEITVFEVAPDGTVWALSEGGAAEGLYSVGRGSDDWTLTTGDLPGRIWITSDGTVWAGLPGGGFGYLGADGWQSVGEFPSDYWGGYLLVSDQGEVWAIDGRARRSRDLQHFVDGAWRTYDGLDGSAGRARGTAVGADGTLWGITHRGAFFRFDGTEWMTFGPPDWMPTDVERWRLVEGEWVPVIMTEERAAHEAALEERGELEDALSPEELRWSSLLWSAPHVAPDGSLWVSARLGEQSWSVEWWRDDSRTFIRPVCDNGIDGVARFDGETWSRYLQGYCIESMDMTADGSVWLLATESGARAEYPLIQTQTYVITPEAVAAAE